MYKYGIRNGSLQMEWKEALEAAGEIGFDGVELVFKEEEELDRLLSDAGRDEVLGWCEASGAAACSLSVGTFGRYKVAAEENDEKARAGIVKMVEKSLRACKGVGGVGLLLPYFEREHMDITEREAKMLVADMKLCAPLAEELQILIGLETSFSSGLLKRICDGIGSDYIGVYQDISNALHFGHDSVELLTALPKETKLIHVKDTKGAMLGEGNVDLPGCAKAFRDIGYDGWLVFETSAGDDAIASAKENLKRAKKVFE